MKIVIKDIVYHANVREVRERIIRVADFAIPSDKIAASLATAAGQLPVSLGAGVWDVLAAPGSSGLSPVSDLDLAKKWKLAAGATVPILTNKSGGDLNAGAVVIADAAASAFKTTATEGDNVIGVLGETIVNDAAGSMLQVGLATVLVQGNVAIGDNLCSSTTAGRAKTATSNKGVFAKAVTAYAGGGVGSVSALVWTAGVYTLLGVDGWTPANETWTYASATTITVPAGAAAIYSVGDKLKWTANGVVIYARVTVVANALLTVQSGVVTNFAITNNHYSKQVRPLGYPYWETPFATAVGSNYGGSGPTDVVFPTGRFTVEPIVVAVCKDDDFFINISFVDATKFTYAVTGGANHTITYIATQMTPASGAG